ncbi:hypothetical protein PG988_004679 [Apiospora saccharicola]
MASALYSLLGFFKNEPPFQPFVDQHIIYPYFVPISPHWAEVETSIFQLVGLDPDTTYRIFPPEYFYPPGFPVLHKGHAQHLFFFALGIDFNSTAGIHFAALDTGTDYYGERMNTAPSSGSSPFSARLGASGLHGGSYPPILSRPKGIEYDLDEHLGIGNLGLGLKITVMGG